MLEKVRVKLALMVNDPLPRARMTPMKKVFSDISLYDHFELPEPIFGNRHVGNVGTKNWPLCTALGYGRSSEDI